MRRDKEECVKISNHIGMLKFTSKNYLKRGIAKSES